MRKDLFICHTPLQIEIAKEIIKKNKLKVFDVIMCADTMTEQFRYYFNTICVMSEHSFYIDTSKSFLNIFKQIRRLKNNKYDNIYVANIDKNHVHAIMSVVDFNVLRTFDDGTLNLTPNSRLLGLRKRTLKSKIAYKILGINFDTRHVLNLSELHYTIFHNRKNIIDKCENITLSLEIELNKNQISSKEINIFLGTMFVDAESKQAEFVASIRKVLPDNCYFIRHPRDKTNEFSELEAIDGLQIAEMKIVKLLGMYSKVNLYGFHSTTQFNLMSHKCITNTMFESPLFPSIRIPNCSFKTIKLKGN